MPARQDAQPVCAPGYAAAGIAERFRDNVQPPVGSTWPRPNEGVRYTQPQPAPSSTQPLYLAGTRTAVMQPENFRPSLQFSSVNVPMPLHRFDGAQVQQQYGLSEGTQRVQTMPNNYGIQPMLVHDDGSLDLGRTQTYSAASGTAGESTAINLQSSVVTYGLGPSPISNFSDRNGVPGPCGQSLGPPFPSYPAVTCGYSSMPYSVTQNEFIQNLHTVQNSNTRNSHEVDLFSENNFHSENNFPLQSVTENNFVSPVSRLYQPVYSNSNMTGLGLLVHSDARGLPLPFRSAQVRRSRGQQLQRHIRYITSRLHPASSVKVSRVQSTRLPTSTLVTVYRRRCSTTTISRLLRQLDFRFRSRRTRLPVQLLLYHICLRRRTVCTIVTFTDICRRCLWIILLLFRHLR